MALILWLPGRSSRTELQIPSCCAMVIRANPANFGHQTNTTLSTLTLQALKCLSVTLEVML